MAMAKLVHVAWDHLGGIMRVTSSRGRRFTLRCAPACRFPPLRVSIAAQRVQ